MPELSIIVTVYNTEPYLRKCLDSILSQSYTDFELICIDNHSTDNSADILKEYVLSDKRVSCYKTPVHGRASGSRAFGLKFATGKFLTYVDADDSLRPGMYAHMFQEQKKHDADIVVCNYDVVYPDRILPSYSQMKDEVVHVGEKGRADWFFRYFCMNKPNNYLWSRIIRREIATANGITFHPVDISEDSIFTMLCSINAQKIAHIENSYYCYYQRKNSTVRETVRAKNIAESFVYAFGTVVDYLNKHNLYDFSQDILPMYAFTRMRSILFYTQDVGYSENEAYDLLRKAISGTAVPDFLRRALTGQSIENYAKIQQLPQDGLEQIKSVIASCLQDIH